MAEQYSPTPGLVSTQAQLRGWAIPCSPCIPCKSGEAPHVGSASVTPSITPNLYSFASQRGVEIIRPGIPPWKAGKGQRQSLAQRRNPQSPSDSEQKAAQAAALPRQRSGHKAGV